METERPSGACTRDFIDLFPGCNAGLFFLGWSQRIFARAQQPPWRFIPSPAAIRQYLRFG
jgi:hypothetical protein